MKSEDTDTATGASEETEPAQVGEEQTEIVASNAFEAELLRQAAEDGHVLGIAPPPKTEPAEPETTEPVEAISDETVVEDEPEEGEEEVVKAKVEKPGDKLVPLSEVLAEREKKKRERTRAEKAEALAEQLKAQLASTVGPQPTEENPFVDIHQLAQLDNFEREYEKIIELADENPDALVEQTVEAEKKRSGIDLLEKLTPEQIAARAKRKAEKAIRKDIPDRRKLLAERAQADAVALEIYPDFMDQDSEFTRVAAVVGQKILSGQAAKDPELLLALGDYARGYLMRVKSNGKHEPNVTPESKKILKAAGQKIAPTPTRTRSQPERATRGSDLEKLNEQFARTRSHADAEKLVAATLSRGSSGPSKVERVA